MKRPHGVCFDATGTLFTLRVRVGNEGEPPRPEDARLLFERFYRVDRASSAPVRGLGLGLAIAKGAVESHGGRIWMDASKPGFTTFVFTLPLDEAGTRPSPSGTAMAAPGAREG